MECAEVLSGCPLCTMPAYPDEYLPTNQLSLAGFIEQANSILEDEEFEGDLHPFAQFVLCGRYRSEGGARRITLNGRQELRYPSRGDYTVRRDYDSVIGITRSLPFQDAISVYPLPPFRDTHRNDNHLTWGIEMHEVLIPDLHTDACY